MRSWSEEEIVKAILLRQENNEPLNASAVRDSDSSLHRSAITYFGTWDKALLAAGLDPREHKKAKNRGRYYESPSFVLHEMRRLKQLGVDIYRVRSLSELDPTLYMACRRHFGTLAEAVNQLDINEGRLPPRQWTERQILIAIRQRLERGESINVEDVMNDDAGLVQAAYKRYKNWDAVISAAKQIHH